MKGKNTTQVYGGFVLVCMLVFGLVWAHSRPIGQDYLEFVLLDVGQGMGVYVHTPQGRELLVDVGPTTQTLRSLEQLRSWYDRHIDFVVGTHADMDHVGILGEIVGRYRVGTVVLGPGVRDADAYRETYVALETTRRYSRGDAWVVGPHSYVRVLHPSGATYSSGNDDSLVLQLVYGDTRFLITGDISKSVEEELVDVYGASLRSDVLVVSHHGSQTSTSPLFVSVVDPEYAVIPVGSDNRYGHPHQVTLDTLESQGVIVLRTDTMGNIVLYSDGEQVLQ